MPKLVSITKDQRELLQSIQADPGMKVPKRSVALSSLVRKGFVTSRHGGYGERERTGPGRVSAPAMEMCEITAAGVARLNPRSSGGGSAGGGAKPIGSAELNKLISAKGEQKNTFARLMAAASYGQGENSEAAIAWEEKFQAAEDELFLLIQTVSTPARRSALIKKHGLGWKL